MSKLRCVNKACQKVFAIADEKLRPYEGRMVALKCPHCGTPQKLRVPKQAPSKHEQISTELFAANTQAGSWKLELLASEYTRAATFTLKEGENRIGRYSDINPNPPDCPIFTTDISVSRNHACIKLFRNRLGILRAQLFDLNSKNGTSLNGKPLREKEVKYLHHGDEIKLGPALTLRVHFLPEG